MKTINVAAGVFCAVLALAGCASYSSSSSAPEKGVEFEVAQPASASGPAAIAPDHRLGPFDKISINVFRQSELTLANVQVDARGQVVMPLLGPVDAAGKTAPELARHLTTELSKDLVNPIVTVTVLDAVTEQVTLAGAVKSPGLFKVNGSASLLQLVTLGGGPDVTADQKNVLVMRTSDGKRMGARFDLVAIKQGKAEDPPIYPGDTIVLDSSRARTIWSQILTGLPVIGLFTAL